LTIAYTLALATRLNNTLQSRVQAAALFAGHIQMTTMQRLLAQGCKAKLVAPHQLSAQRQASSMCRSCLLRRSRQFASGAYAADAGASTATSGQAASKAQGQGGTLESYSCGLALHACQCYIVAAWTCLGGCIRMPDIMHAEVLCTSSFLCHSAPQWCALHTLSDDHP
jgi:hypothetical protein